MHFPRPTSYYFIVFFTIAFGCTSTEKEAPAQVVPSEHAAFTLPDLPNAISFGGAQVPLTNFDVKERLDKELIVNTYYHSSTIQAFKRAHRYFEEISALLKEENIPDDFKYLCLIESGLAQVTSPSGAKGFWQFMPQTANEYGLRIDEEVDERMHIEKSTRMACAYLRDANDKFNDWFLTAAAYNRGVGGIQGALEDQEVNSYFDLHLPGETSRYVFRILALKLIFEQPEAYGFDPNQMYLYEPIKTRKVSVSESITNLKHWAIEQGSNYRMLKLLNPWILSDKLTIRNEVLTIELPA